jgi:hypothetical protein
MRNLLILAAAGGLMVAPAFAETLNGTISDSKCGAKHEAATEADAKCAASCMKHGAEAVLVTDGKVLKIAAEGGRPDRSGRPARARAYTTPKPPDARTRKAGCGRLT